MLNNEVLIIYNFLNFIFIILFTGISLLYIIAVIYRYYLKYRLKLEAKRFISFVNPLILKYYILSIIWIIVVYLYR